MSCGCHRHEVVATVTLHPSQTLNNSLQDPSVPMNEENFFDCIETVVDSQRILEDNLKQLPNLAKANDRKAFATAIDEISGALASLQGTRSSGVAFPL